MKAVLILAFAGRFCYIPAIVKFFDDGKSMIKLNSKKIAEIVGSPMVVVDADIDEVVTDSRLPNGAICLLPSRARSLTGTIL